MLLRDSAELPIDIVVKTVVTDAKGKPKRRSQGSVHLLFKGYNQQSGNWSFRANAGLFNYRILHKSTAPTLALFDAFTTLAPKEPRDDLEIKAGRPGEPILIQAPFKDCREFVMMAAYPYPAKRCYAAEFRASGDPAGELTIESFVFDIGALPAAAKIGYFGDVQVQKIHAEGELQKASLPGDTRPFLIPKHVRVSITTDKGSVELTNDYTLKPEKPRK